MKSKDGDRLLASGLLEVGYCPNGDMVVIDLRDRVGAIGYVSHDYVWENPSFDPREYCAFVADSLDHLAELGSTDGNLPIDYFAARKRG